MDITIYPQKLRGVIQAIPSKSQAHRLLICAAFADQNTTIFCPQTNQDIEATADCLRALGANILRADDYYTITPIRAIPKEATLNCQESGSTLRFLLPIVGALGVDATFQMRGRLPQRPLSPLWEEMERMGCILSRPADSTIRCTGRLQAGCYTIRGDVSSQFITGLLFALSLIPGKSQLTVTGRLESKPYVDMTLQAMDAFCVHISNLQIDGPACYRSPGSITVEGDWSNAAFFLAAQELGNILHVEGLNPASAQGDRAVKEILHSMTQPITVDASDIPDLVPILTVSAAGKYGATFTGIRRLRLKESDRVTSVISMLCALGITADATEDTLTVHPGQFHGGMVDSANDHRIAMAAAIAATIAQGPVTILNAHCVSKSYPTFWEEYRKLGGNYEQYIW